MPPKGLYPIPRHHLNGQAPPSSRPVYNTNDFADDTSKPVTTMNGPADEMSKDVIRAQKKQEKREEKMKKKEKKLAKEAQTKKALEEAAVMLPTPAANLTKKEKKQASKAQVEKAQEETAKVLPNPSGDATPATPVKNGRYGPRGPYRKREKSPNGTPISAKKRKRESEAHVDAPVATNNDTSLLSDGFLEGLKNTMGDLSTFFGSQAVPNETPSPSPKKRGRPPGTGKKALDSIEPATQRVGDTTYNGTPSGESKSKKQKKEKNSKSSNLNKTFQMIKTPVPVPSIASTLLSRTKTPVPFPQGPASHITGSVNEPSPKKSKKAHRKSEVLVTETPQSQMPRTPVTTRMAPIPFSLSKASTTTPSGRSKTTKKAPTVHVSDGERTQAPASAPAKESTKAVTTSHVPLPGSNQSAFTASNLMSYKEPLNDKPKPRPVGRAASIATSTTSSVSSMSIIDAFARVGGKPYTKPGAPDDPFTATTTKKKAPVETHDEGDLATFTTAYHALQKTVNFTDEKEYMDEHQKWTTIAAAAGPLPCLHKATGCSPKGEAMLRLQREDPSTALQVLVTTSSDAKALETAITASTDAESLLAHAITARIPVPLGRIEGIWHLFSPAYSRTHVDKYGFGQRTLTISSIAGFKSGQNYTARLSLPPRSMTYSILTFTAPPHASFRTTTLKTTAEGYKAEIMFLGNGYLKLRLDLHLLLMGKPAEGKWGKLGMEFLGVHERAVRWREEVKEELRPEEKRFLDRFEGVYGR